MAVERKDSLDALTRAWSAQAAEDIIGRYLLGRTRWGGDALLLIEFTGVNESGIADGEQRAEDGVLKRMSFFLQDTLKRTDTVARIGDACFLVFLLGCRSKDVLYNLIDTVKKEALRDGGFSFAAGGAVSNGEGQTYESLLNEAKAGLFRAKKEKSCFYLMKPGDGGSEEESGWAFGPIREYEPDSRMADMEFVREMMDLSDCGMDCEASVNRGLEKICRYFGAGESYIVERKSGGKGFEVTFDWRSFTPCVNNNNLRVIPSLVGERYLELFGHQKVLVCNRIQELERLNPISAERQKLRNSKALLQCPIMESGVVVGYISINDSIKERIWSQREIMTFYLAGRVIASQIMQLRFQRFTKIMMDYDRLTEAWKYSRFLDEGSRRLQSSSLLQAVVTMDIKNFRVINAGYGFETGNTILIHISLLLNSFTGGNECFARIEADKFILLLEYQTMNGLLHRLEQLIRRVEQITADEKLDFNLSCVMGICLVEPGDKDMSVLADHANMARKAQKDYHKSAYNFYNKEAELEYAKERKMSLRMKGALERKEFLVYYQPKISLSQHKIIGLEALVRWKTEEGEIIPPNDFIPLFEKNGFITELDLYVLECVCEQIRSWIDEGKEPFPIAVNISRLHINKDNFMDGLTTLTEKHGIPEKYLELEITESAFLHEPKRILGMARKIKEQGFILTMDDFGTGYSSLSLLKDLPVDIIKLDMEFFRKDLSRREKVIISNVIHMAKQLDIQVISEGIETMEHELFLKEIGCDLAQGYRYGRPAPIEDYLPQMYGNYEGC